MGARVARGRWKPARPRGRQGAFLPPPGQAPGHQQKVVTLLTSPIATISALRGLLDGRVLLPGDRDYERACTPWNLAVEQRPAAVALPANAREVAAVIRAAGESGLKVVPQATGHSAAPLAGQLENAVLLRTSHFTGVWVDPARGIARVLGGTPWQRVVAPAAAHNLAALHGSAPGVGVIGYTLGGGLSWVSRQHGLACNQVTAAELVGADGKLIRVHADSSPELFWGLRGGGGNLGVVTALEMRLLPLGDVYAGVMIWDATRAAEVCRAWAAWTHGLGDEVTTSLRLLGRPGNASERNLFPGRQVVVIDGALLADDARAEKLLAPLRALQPKVDTFTRIAAGDLVRLHFDPELPSSGVSDHTLLDDFDADAADAFVAVAGVEAPTSLVSAEIRHLGGALGRTDLGGGALNQLPGNYSAYFLADAANPDLATTGQHDATLAVEALAPWSSGRRFLNFTERTVDAATAFAPATLARLQLLRKHVDPTGLIVGNHPLD